MKYFRKEYFNKNDLKHYWKYGPMDFEWSQAFTYFCIIDFPIQTIIFIIYMVIKYG